MSRHDLMAAARRYLPILDWGREYNRESASADLMAALIVTIMLIPQSLAYAMLAGLPPEVGLYASILPLAIYAVFGTSRSLAVGPVAVVSLMTAAAIGSIAAPGSPEILAAAITLAFLSGLFLLALGFFRLGFLANFLSHPVISGFITASGILIALSQVKHILGVKADGVALPEVLASLVANLGQTNPATLAIGAGVLSFLYFVRSVLPRLLKVWRIPGGVSTSIVRSGPVIAVAVTIAVAWWFSLDRPGVRLVGAVPQGLPPLSKPSFSMNLWLELAGAAALISIIGFVESVSVAQTLAARKRQRIDPDQELVALGASNVAASFSGGYPVTGGFARSVVNYDAGAETPAAGAFAAVGILVAVLTLTPVLAFLPRATLAATIIVAVLSLVDFGILKKAWIYSKADFAAVATTIAVTLLMGVEAGVSAGVGLSVLI